MDDKEATHHPIQSPRVEEPNESTSSLCKKAAEITTLALETYRRKPLSHWLLLIVSSTAMLTAFPASSLLSRLYYDGGGLSKWILSWSAVAGWPLTALLLLPFYLSGRISPTPLSLKLFLWYVLLGFLSAADNLMYAWAYAYLPASTASLLAASSLIFSALFGYLIAKNKTNLSSINAIVVITAGVVIIALDSKSDRYKGITDRQYTVGFVWDIVGSALHGLIFALSELVFMKILGRRSFHVVLEQQVMVSFAAFAFTSVGLVANGDFRGMRAESRSFNHGEASYVMVLSWAAVTFQLGVLGATGVVFLASTVLAGVLNAVRVPLTSVAAVILFHDPMSGFKILSLVITVWGFCSYVVGHSY
ncbi:probable purine permease 5 [Typha latifolia]|uniref:probable purine permease 5 n=1 Tax=Typha latifolia TaxID=4733 RepID=UPI003C2EE88D